MSTENETIEEQDNVNLDGEQENSDSTGKGKTFTQKELDIILKDRIAREKKNQLSKEEIKEYNDFKASKQTESEKLELTKTALNETVQKANTKLIKAEIKNLEGYDNKLLSRLLDMNSIEVDDNGDVTGIEEQLTEIEKDFPSVKKVQGTTTGANPPPTVKAGSLEQLQTELETAQKNHDTLLSISIKRKMFEKQKL